MPVHKPGWDDAGGKGANQRWGAIGGVDSLSQPLTLQKGLSDRKAGTNSVSHPSFRRPPPVRPHSLPPVAHPAHHHASPQQRKGMSDKRSIRTSFLIPAPEAASNTPDNAVEEAKGDNLLRILNGGEGGRKTLPPTSVALDRLDELFSFIFSTYFTSVDASSVGTPDALSKLQRRESLAVAIKGLQPPHTTTSRDPIQSYYMLFRKLIADRIKVSSRPLRVLESLIDNWKRRVVTVVFMSWRFHTKLSRTLWTRNVKVCDERFLHKLYAWRRRCFNAWRSHSRLKHKREHILESEETRNKLVHRMARRITELELENKLLKETVARLSIQQREIASDLKGMTSVVATKVNSIHAPYVDKDPNDCNGVDGVEETAISPAVHDGRKRTTLSAFILPTSSEASPADRGHDEELYADRSLTRAPTEPSECYEPPAIATPHSAVSKADDPAVLSLSSLQLLSSRLPVFGSGPATERDAPPPRPPTIIKHADVLEWVARRCQMMLEFNAPSRRVTNFGSDFKDGVRMAYLLVSLGFSKLAAQKTLRARRKKRRAALIEAMGSLSDQEAISSTDSSPSLSDSQDGTAPEINNVSPRNHVLLRAKRQKDICGLVELVSNPLTPIPTKEVYLTDALRCFLDLVPLLPSNVKSVGDEPPVGATRSQRGSSVTADTFSKKLEAQIATRSREGSSSQTTQLPSPSDGVGEEEILPVPGLPPLTPVSLPLLSSGPAYISRIVFALYQAYQGTPMQMALYTPVSEEAGLMVLRHFFPEAEARERNHDRQLASTTVSGTASSCGEGEAPADGQQTRNAPSKNGPTLAQGELKSPPTNTNHHTVGMMELFRREYTAEHYTALYTDLANSDTDSDKI